jgi:hypothetical protein
MYFDGDERAKRVMYESFAPGPKFGESIAIDFVRMDGLSGLFFAAAKIGALIASRPKEVDLGWLWSQAIEICGEQEAQTALREAGAADPAIEAYRTAALERSITYGISRSEQAATPSYEQLKSSLPGVRAYRLSMWGKHASAEDLELAANGLAAAQTPEEQIQHLRMFSKRAFPLDPGPLLALALSPNEGVASAAAVALKLITDARVRDAAFELVEQRREGRHSSIAMLSQNREPNDHDIALRWFENESDRHTRHWMGMDLRSFWKRHPDPAGEIRMLSSLYERGPCSFCREYVVRRLLELESLSASIRAECAYDANDEVRSLVEAT